MTASVIWITGLSGSGKTTLANELAKEIVSTNKNTILLDGDVLREILGASSEIPQNNSREGRIAISKKYSKLCYLLASQGFTVIISTISMFSEIYDWNRKYLPNYFEIYLKVPIGELRKRDPKKIYKMFDSGKLRHVAGLDLAIDEPKTPDFVVEFNSEQSATNIAKKLLQILNKRKLK